MKLELTDVQENKLFHRKDIKFTLHHEGATTPTRMQAKELLAGELGSTNGKVIVAHMAGGRGHALTFGTARVYDDVKVMQDTERKHFLKRNEGKKAEEAS